MVATNLCNGSHATPFTQPLWSSNIFSLEPFLTSKTIAVESVLHEIKNCEQGDQARPMTSCKWPRKVVIAVQFSLFTGSSLFSAKRSGAASVSEYDQSQTALSEKIPTIFVKKIETLISRKNPQEKFVKSIQVKSKKWKAVISWKNQFVNSQKNFVKSIHVTNIK